MITWLRSRASLRSELIETRVLLRLAQRGAAAQALECRDDIATERAHREAWREAYEEVFEQGAAQAIRIAELEQENADLRADALRLGGENV